MASRTRRPISLVAVDRDSSPGPRYGPIAGCRSRSRARHGDPRGRWACESSQHAPAWAACLIEARIWPSTVCRPSVKSGMNARRPVTGTTSPGGYVRVVETWPIQAIPAAGFTKTGFPMCRTRPSWPPCSGLRWLWTGFARPTGWRLSEGMEPGTTRAPPTMGQHTGRLGDAGKMLNGRPAAEWFPISGNRGRHP
jgi:hypothetical protein